MHSKRKGKIGSILEEEGKGEQNQKYLLKEG
jgi:hypothetical protein